MTYELLRIPKVSANDDVVTFGNWFVDNGVHVAQNTKICEVITTKAAIDVFSEFEGYLFHLVSKGEIIPCTSVFAVVSSDQNLNLQDIRSQIAGRSAIDAVDKDSRWTKKAEILAQRHGVDISKIPAVGIIKEKDVMEYVERINAEKDQDHDNEISQIEKGLDALGYKDLIELLTLLRRKVKLKHKRHIPLGSLLNDRLELAKFHGAKEGSTIYDECNIWGDVRIGKNCWIGPFSVLDGAHATLSIGDHTSIGMGAQIYTHDTIEQALTGGQAARFVNETKIGKCCFIAPLTVIGPGSSIGDHSFVATGSFVQGTFPSYSYISGNPAKKVGVVELKDNKADLRLFKKEEL